MTKFSQMECNRSDEHSLCPLSYKNIAYPPLLLHLLLCRLELECDIDKPPITRQTWATSQGTKSFKIKEISGQTIHLPWTTCPSLDGYLREKQISLFFEPLYFEVLLLWQRKWYLSPNTFLKPEKMPLYSSQILPGVWYSYLWITFWET